MNEHNQELIVDLLAGRLPPDEERVALARIEEDSDLRSEYEAQMSTISVLGASATPMMTADERELLHASLRRQLHLDEAPGPVVVAPSRWQRWWAPIGGLAVAAAVVFGIVVLPGVLSGSDSDGTFETASAEITTTAPSTSLSEDLAGVTGDEGTRDNSAGAAAPEATETGPVEEESADVETQAVDAYEASIADTLPYLTDVDLDVLGNDLASDPDTLRSGAPSASSKSSELDAALVDACVDSLQIDNPSSEVFPVALTMYRDVESVVVSVSPSVGDDFLAIYSVVLCAELASTRG